ncbi:MAG: hypothetical protein O2820_15235 [Planctomycetota bacterium]|nr:hypothetical protein [Planctomycetota bacterium]MDA1250569.1 hypothetical protein [Planctomycetota bacterium]
MSEPLTADQIFDRVFLETRAKLLAVAATLDRLDRAEGTDRVRNDFRMEQLRKSIDIIQNSSNDRAEQLQIVFSDPYDEQWKRPGLRT